MGIQTKLELSRGADTIIPIEINNNLPNRLFYFYEYQKVKLKFVSDNKNDYIELESYNNKEFDFYKNDYGTIRLTPEDEVEISSGGDNEDMLVPGEYYIKVFKDGKTYESMYEVIPSNSDSSSVEYMRNYLEETLNGLSYNIYKERSFKKDFSSSQMNFDLQKYLESECILLFNYMNMIVHNPITDIQKKYEVKSYSRRPDSKSQRWAYSKGVRYNKENSENRFYEKHSYITYDVLENRNLKNILEYIYDLIIDMNSNYIREISTIEKSIKTLEEKYKTLQISQDELSNTIGYSKRLYEIGGDLKFVENSIESEKKKKNLIKTYLYSINKMKNQVGYYLNETWIKDIKSNLGQSILTKNIFRNKNYLEIYELHNRLKTIKENKFYKKEFAHRRTSNLFEIYVFLLVKEVFEDLGFKWSKGWLKEVKNIESMINVNLDSGESIILEKDNVKVVISYDKLIKRDIEVKESCVSQVISSFVNNRQPDILISVYKDNKFVKSMVVEAKYRRKSYIYNELNNTDVMYQVMSYRNFVYYDGDIKKVSMTHSKPIEKVFVMYISDEDSFTHDMYDDIEFIAINPTSKVVGNSSYNEIKNKISMLLNI